MLLTRDYNMHATVGRAVAGRERLQNIPVAGRAALSLRNVAAATQHCCATSMLIIVTQLVQTNASFVCQRSIFERTAVQFSTLDEIRRTDFDFRT